MACFHTTDVLLLMLFFYIPGKFRTRLRKWRVLLGRFPCNRASFPQDGLVIRGRPLVGKCFGFYGRVFLHRSFLLVDWEDSFTCCHIDRNCIILIKNPYTYATTTNPLVHVARRSVNHSLETVNLLSGLLSDSLFFVLLVFWELWAR